MAWTDDRIVELLQLLRTEPCIWHPKHRNYYNKILVNDAWIRIRDNFSIHCSLEELKRKRNSLFTQYRDCLKKIKESKHKAAQLIYVPDWFAFKIMNGFLARLYEDDCEEEAAALKKRQNALLLQSQLGTNASADPAPIEPPFAALIADPKLTPDPLLSSLSKRKQKKQKFINSAPKLPNKVTDNPVPEKSNKSNEDDSDLYGQLLAQKLKHLKMEERLTLMNDIDNIVFKYMMDARQRKASAKQSDNHFNN